MNDAKIDETPVEATEATWQRSKRTPFTPAKQGDPSTFSRNKVALNVQRSAERRPQRPAVIEAVRVFSFEGENDPSSLLYSRSHLLSLATDALPPANFCAIDAVSKSKVIKLDAKSPIKDPLDLWDSPASTTAFNAGSFFAPPVEAKPIAVVRSSLNILSLNNPNELINHQSPFLADNHIYKSTFQSPFVQSTDPFKLISEPPNIFQSENPKPTLNITSLFNTDANQRPNNDDRDIPEKENTTHRDNGKIIQSSPLLPFVPPQWLYRDLAGVQQGE